ncbi:hypothetical protein B0T19DRAFT_437392 [Cercophora scortea]|uniref:C2H2-type domain-containing protein n=1 Tax=Cercophora scortea TaxID=314031 RepID=A0AAE0J4B1_9PEZI|nr:hypothetical protein B0T19DRAFT_437392 [Cercophora scortea]
MAPPMISTHYAPQQNVHYGYAPPPSPPMDDASRCSLPSISNLLGLADQGSPTSETSPQSQQSYSSKPETRPSSSHFGNPAMTRTALPPSPPMSSDASFEGYNSPSTKSISQLSSSSNYYFEATPPLSQMEAHETRQIATAVPRVPVHASAYQPQFSSPYMGQSAMASYYPPMQPTPPPHQQMPALYYQRPLPQAFPPMPMSVSMTPSTGATNPWQLHHHYIAPSSAASFPQSQDRYICQTCSKAFSRPSSLRIHSHSHTGEKPFKCPHTGCGKAFSVRSNMKRHERGCHSFESSSSGSALVS